MVGSGYCGTESGSTLFNGALYPRSFFVLLWGPGGHEVVADGEGVLWVGVDSGEFLGVGNEDLLSEEELFLGSVGDTVAGDVLEEIEVGGKLVF